MAVALLAAAAVPLEAQSLRMSSRSMELQSREAKRLDLRFAANSKDVKAMVADGELVPVKGNDDFLVKEDVSFPYARPEVRDFVTALAKEYREACGEQLVVTSLARARNRQPRNASTRSVHPAGMAVDLRRSWQRPCRTWMDQTLLHLEYHGLIEASLEWNPVHYHIAVFLDRFSAEGEKVLSQGFSKHYFVQPGDTLWKIAKRHGTSVELVQKVNGIRSGRIYPGQRLSLP